MTRFAPDRLRLLAGDAAFARGEAYHVQGAVSLLSSAGEEILAVVRGGEHYRVRLRGGGDGSRISGDCTCPAFDRDGWCKHLVAAALAANAAGEELRDLRGDIRAHLLGLGAEALADMLLDLAERDPALLRRLDLAASAARAPVAEHVAKLAGDTARWAAASPLCGLRRGRRLDRRAPRLAGASPGADRRRRGGEAKDLLETVLDELPDALEQVDDLDGGGMEILERAAALHLEACRTLRPDPSELAAELFERAWDDEFGTFDRADETYAELLGAAGLAEYRRLAEAAHARLPSIGRDRADPKAADRRLLTEILDRFAAREGDLDPRIALRRAALAGAHDYLDLARFCLEQGRPALALEVAEDGAWLFEDATGTALVGFLAERLVAEGRREQAIAALWRGFERAPAFSLFRTLQALDAPEPAADRALSVLRARRTAMDKADRWRLGALVEARA